MPHRALSYLLVAVASSLLTLGAVGASRGSASSATAAGSTGVTADVPPGLLIDLVQLDRKLARLIASERAKGGLDRDELISRVKEIESAKLAMVDQFFGQPVYGVKFSEVFRQLDCLDQQLKLGSGIQIGEGAAAARQDLIARTVERGKGCKQKLENELRKAAGQPPPKVSLNTLHSFDLTPGQQAQLAVASTTSAGTDTTDVSQLNADAVIENAYGSNGFVGRHERDYVAVGVSNLPNPDSWPAGQSVRFFVAFDLFKTVAGAAAAAEASRLDDEAIKLARISGSPMGLGEAVFQGIPVGSDVLSTIVVLQRGQVVVKIASACRGCPIGTLPADTAAFVKAQVAQGEAKGLSK